ncbi:MAG: hypothetical protein AB7F41_04815 [Methylocystis sp.]|uniref:hypothetical protein n=1 Tax=Methylocystis sp. TaxID=1911079 RepID=UPI003D0F2828
MAAKQVNPPPPPSHKRTAQSFANALYLRQFLEQIRSRARYTPVRKGCVMPNKAWRKAIAREADRQFAAALTRIGERLRLKQDSIVKAPLPARMQALLDELRSRRSARSRDRG